MDLLGQVFPTTILTAIFVIGVPLNCYICCKINKTNFISILNKAKACSCFIQSRIVDQPSIGGVSSKSELQVLQGALNLSDLCILVFYVPMQLYQLCVNDSYIWQTGYFRYLQVLLMWMPLFMSGNIHICVAVNKLQAARKIDIIRRMSIKENTWMARTMLLAVTVLSALFTIPIQVIVAGAMVQHTGSANNSSKKFDQYDTNNGLPVVLIHLCLISWFPFISIAICYSFIAVRFGCVGVRGQLSTARLRRAGIAACGSAVVLSISYMVCWIPYNVTLILSNMESCGYIVETSINGWKALVHLVALNTCLNPIMYLYQEKRRSVPRSNTTMRLNDCPSRQVRTYGSVPDYSRLTTQPAERSCSPLPESSCSKKLSVQLWRTNKKDSVVTFNSESQIVSIN